MQAKVYDFSTAYDSRTVGHSLIANDRFCEGLVLSTPDFALQNRPPKGGSEAIGLQELLIRREGLQSPKSRQ